MKLDVILLYMYDYIYYNFEKHICESYDSNDIQYNDDIYAKIIMISNLS